MKNSIILVMVAALALIAAPAFSKPDKAAKTLPPGLQKKADNGNLPPGWQKKMVVGGTVSEGIVDQGVIIDSADDSGVVTIKVEDKIIRLIKATREIVEIVR